MQLIPNISGGNIMATSMSPQKYIVYDNKLEHHEVLGGTQNER
jgi:hypothetical protein